MSPFDIVDLGNHKRWGKYFDIFLKGFNTIKKNALKWNGK
jgi:hypothetical protein